jgi:hypothetical protein
MPSRLELVKEQYDKFLAELPALKAKLRGRWVVYRDGVQSDHPDEATALRAGFAKFGASTAFTVACVVDPEPMLLTAAHAYRYA